MIKTLCKGTANLADYDKDSLEYFFQELGEKPFRAQQVIQWIHKHGVTDLSKMTNLSINLRNTLTNHSTIKMPKIKNVRRSNDGTIKLIIELITRI